MKTYSTQKFFRYSRTIEYTISYICDRDSYNICVNYLRGGVFMIYYKDAEIKWGNGAQKKVSTRLLSDIVAEIDRFHIS